MSKIEWTDKTWNPVHGCTKISTGCENCYAETMANRLKAMGTKGYEEGFKVTLAPDKLDEPLKWKKPQKIFVCSMADLFHEDVPFEFIEKVYRNMLAAPQHTFQILTKRPERMLRFYKDCVDYSHPDRFKHIWLGVTAENQEQANKRIPILLKTAAAKRFVSIEPMLGAVDLRNIIRKTNIFVGKKLPKGHFYYIGQDALKGNEGVINGSGFGIQNINKLDWVICGGESGPGARPMHPDWVRGIRDQCKDAEVPFFFKQWGEWLPSTESYPGEYQKITHAMTKEGVISEFKRDAMIKADKDVMSWMGLRRIGKKAAGCLLNGIEHKEMP